MGQARVASLVFVLGLAAGCGFELTPGSTPADARADASADAPDPMLDTDNDGVLDGTDNCPGVPNPDQRDFEADARGDACDPCPHLINMDTDTDGDTVGDACDPQPAVAAERRALWTSFHTPTEIDGWTLYGQFGVTNGKLVHTNSAEAHPSIAPSATFQRTYAAIGAELTSNGVNNSAIGLCTDTTGGALYYCCELRQSGTARNAVALSRWSSYNGTQNMPWAGTFATGSRFSLELDILGQNKCTVRQGSTVAISNSQSNGPHDGYVFIYVDYAMANIEYLFVVETM